MILNIGTMYPEKLREVLTDANSSFYKREEINALGLTPQSPLVQKLLRLTSGGVTSYPDDFHMHTANDLGIGMADLRSLGRGVYDTWLMLDVNQRDGSTVRVDAGEFIAWQGTNPKGKIPSAPGQFVDQWSAANNLPLKTQETEHRAGDQDIFIENAIGSTRVVGAGNFPTAKYTINYGNERIIDRDRGSPGYGHPLLVGHDGELDVNVPADVLRQIDAGTPYRGPVTIKCRDEEGRSDPKVLYLAKPSDAVLAEAGNFGTQNMVPVTSVSGVALPPGTQLPQSFIDYNAGDKAHYITMSGSQYMAWKYALSEHAELRNVAPDKWIIDTFGTRERFDAAFKPYGDGALTRDQYHRVLRADVVQTPAPAATVDAAAQAAYWRDKAIPNVQPEYIKSIQDGLKNYGLMDKSVPSTGVITNDPADPTRKALAQLQAATPGTGSNGDLTFGAVDALNAKATQMNAQMTALSGKIAEMNGMRTAILTHIGDAKLQAALVSVDGKAGFSVDDIMVFEGKFSSDPANYDKVKQIAQALVNNNTSTDGKPVSDAKPQTIAAPLPPQPSAVRTV